MTSSINRNFIKRLQVLDNVLPAVQDSLTRAKGSVVVGTVTQVKTGDDAKGEVKVVFSALDPDTEGTEGTTALESRWISPATPFEGQAPESLIGEKVSILLENSDWNTAYYSSSLTTQEPAGTVQRVATYDRGKLPPASATNLGAIAIEKDYPPGSHSLVTVVKKNGRYFWAGSSHSLMETTPLSYEAQELVSRAAAQKDIFQSAADSVMSGEAFKSIKNKKERAILTALSNAALRAVMNPVMSVIAPLADVGRRFLEASMSRHMELVNQVTTVADKLESFAEFTASDPRSIPKAISAVKDLLSGALKAVKTITEDVKQYIGQDLIQGAIGELKNFPSQIQAVLPQITKQMPKVLGSELTRIVGGEAGKLLEKAVPFVSQGTLPDLSEVLDLKAKGLGFISDELAQVLTYVNELPEAVVNLLPPDLQPFLDFPNILNDLVNGAKTEVSNTYKVTVDPESNVLTAQSINPASTKVESQVTGTVNPAANSLMLDTWEQLDLGQLRATVRQIWQRTPYDIFVKGGSTAFFPSLGFELVDKENDLWQYQD